MSYQNVQGLRPSPSVVCIFSGKRKSGKDFIVGKLQNLIGEELCQIVRLSGPLKHEYAKIHGLDFNKLLDSSVYKEKYRKDMIKWGEEKRNNDPSYFCDLASQNAYVKDSTGGPVTKPIWFISDARRITDVQYFRTNYPNVLHIRICASLATRTARGWVFVGGVDDAVSECGLDDEKYDSIVMNDNNDDNQLMNSLEDLCISVKSYL